MDEVTKAVREANLLARQTKGLKKSLAAIEQKGYNPIDKNNVDKLKSKIAQNEHNLSTAAERVYNGELVQSRNTTK